MNIRTFCAPSVDVALAQVRGELGTEAIILSSREVPFSPAHVRFEVMAARESAPLAGPSPTYGATARSRRDSAALPRVATPVAPGRGGAADQATSLLEQQLTRQDIDPRLARELANRLRAAGGGPEKALAALMSAGGLVLDATPRDGVTVLLGGTGVGKTTTLAKLAARLASAGERPALLTCDTWRVAAVEQLAVFAELIGAPLAVAYTPAEMTEAAAGFLAEGRTLLVDTPGRAPRDREGLERLKTFLDALPARRTHLVVPAHLRAGDIEALLEAWRPFAFDRVLLTKLDETTTCGTLLTLLIKARQPASWITFGQNVPDDLAPARPAELARLILEGALDVGAELKTA